ncbi:hypothetical protein [Corallococcus carmarthensis]|uniref:hypothetical protein n=1 Tax=Corallococcus carmarthensis TaxID=2316728 RepID=UPI001315A633|nr:hypothetical protein [Corallococcus carmarthensis]
MSSSRSQFSLDIERLVDVVTGYGKEASEPPVDGSPEDEPWNPQQLVGMADGSKIHDKLIGIVEQYVSETSDRIAKGIENMAEGTEAHARFAREMTDEMGYKKKVSKNDQVSYWAELSTKWIAHFVGADGETLWRKGVDGFPDITRIETPGSLVSLLELKPYGNMAGALKSLERYERALDLRNVKVRRMELPEYPIGTTVRAGDYVYSFEAPGVVYWRYSTSPRVRVPLEYVAPVALILLVLMLCFGPGVFAGGAAAGAAAT